MGAESCGLSRLGGRALWLDPQHSAPLPLLRRSVSGRNVTAKMRDVFFLLFQRVYIPIMILSALFVFIIPV